MITKEQAHAMHALEQVTTRHNITYAKAAYLILDLERMIQSRHIDVQFICDKGGGIQEYQIILDMVVYAVFYDPFRKNLRTVLNPLMDKHVHRQLRSRLIGYRNCKRMAV